METTPLLPDPPSGVPQARRFLLHIALFLAPLAAAQIAVYDVLFDVVCGHAGLPPATCSREPRAAAEVGDLLAAAGVLNGVAATAAAAVLSALSDRLGRKFGLLWFMAASVVGTALFPVVAYILPAQWTPWRLLAPYAVLAVSGSPSTLLNLSVLHLSDILHAEERTRYLSFVIGVAMAVQAVAPGVGAAVLGCVAKPVYLGGCAALMAAAALLFAWQIREPCNERSEREEHLEAGVERQGSLQREGRRIKQALRLLTFHHCSCPSSARTVFANFVLSNMFAVGTLDLLMVYAKYAFGWSGPQIGANVGRLFFVRTAWALGGFPLLHGWLSRRWPSGGGVSFADRVVMLLCNALTCAGYVLLGSATSSAQYSRALGVLANDGVAGPVWISALLQHVPAAQKGEFMAALSVVVKPVEAAGPALLLKALTVTLETKPAAVFYGIAGVSALMVLSLHNLRTQHL